MPIAINAIKSIILMLIYLVTKFHINAILCNFTNVSVFMFRKTSVALFLCVASFATSLQAVQVIESPYGAMAKGFSDGFSKGLSQGASRKSQEKALKKEQKRLEKQIAKERAILRDILKDYDPSKNSEYVLRILHSDLSNDTKGLVIPTLNQQYQLYLEEQKTKGVLSWFSVKK